MGVPPFSIAPGVNWLSSNRLGKECLGSPNLAAALDCWLSLHPQVSDRISWHPPGGPSVTWKDWTFGLKNQLHNHFLQAVNWYHSGMPAAMPEPFPMPLPKDIPADPAIGFGLCMTEQRAKNVYFSYVANTLAVELMARVPWTITSYSATELNRLLGFSELLQYRPLGNKFPATKFPGYYLQSNYSPATPSYVAHFFKENSLLGSSALDTVSRLFGWCRRLLHWFTDASSPLDAKLFWGPAAPPIGVSQVIEGTTYTGKVFPPPYSGHFTAGCGGTTAFMQSALRAMNIPVEDRAGGGHHMPFFWTIDRTLSHGDDPYNWLSKFTAFPGWPVPSNQQYLISGAQWTLWFGPLVDPVKAEANVDRRVADLAIHYQADHLLKLYCEDMKAQVSHGNSQVFQVLSKFYTVAELEAKQLWQKLDAKVIATGFCSLKP